MAKNKIKVIKEFYGGIVRDEKSKVRGGCLNIEEFDIFTNADYIQAEQIMSSDAMPTGTEVYSYTADEDDNVWGYGKQTSNNAVRLVRVTSGGSTNPGAFSTIFTSADTTDICYIKSPIQFFRRDDGDFLYYVTRASTTVKLKSYAISGGTESEQDAGASNMTLTQLDGSFDKIAMRVIFGTLYITNGKYISSIDKDGVFTENAFTLPNGMEAVDIVGVSDIAIILARSVNRLENECKAYWWDLTAPLQFDDHFDIPMGGPQWIVKFKEKILVCCAQGGQMRFFSLSGAFPGGVPLSLTRLDEVEDETATQDISPPHSICTRDNVLYFGVYRTEKTGIYALGQVDETKPLALILSKRFSTTAYTNHKPYSLLIQGPNYYAAFDDNGTSSNTRCESNNSPARSSNAVYESVILDDDDPTSDKEIKGVYVTTKPIPASTDIDAFLSGDYSSFSEVFRPDGTSFNTSAGVLGYYSGKKSNIKTWSVKIQVTSNGADTPKITSIGFDIWVDDKPAFKKG